MHTIYSKRYVRAHSRNHAIEIARNDLATAAEVDTGEVGHTAGGLVFDELWVLAVTYHEPEDGLVLYGPYATSDQANHAWWQVKEDFMNEGVLPEDVTREVTRLEVR